MNDNLTAENLQLKTFLIQQQQAINTSHDQLQVNSFIHYAKKGVYIVGEIVMYIFFTIGALIAMIIPLDPVSGNVNLNQSNSVSGTYHNDDITKVMLVIKICIFLFSLGFIVAGIVFRRLRKKNNLVMTAYKTIDQMKTSFDEYTATWTKSIPQ